MLIKRFCINNIPGPDGFTNELFQTFKVVLLPMILKLFQEIEEAEFFSNSFSEANIMQIPKRDRDTLKKRELQVDIFDEYRCKNFQNNAS